MSKLDTSPYKGVRDFYPEDQSIQNYIFSVWKSVSERFGYEEYNASILEPTEIYKEKSGEEIVSEQTFTFTDRGGRDVTLRPEMTPTLARMVAAKRRELGFPLRWYSIPNVFRYEAPQRGRLREHWQWNADIFGVENISAEVEIIALADRILKTFGATSSDFEIRLNSNSPEGITDPNLVIVINALQKSGITNVRIDETVIRGQAYYTGVVFEFYDSNPANTRSLFGGGRYDDLLSLFDEEKIPAVGIAAGDVSMRDFLETHGLLPAYKPAAKLAVLPTSMAIIDEMVKFVIDLRMAGINLAVDWSERKLGDKIKMADKLKIPYVLVYGEDEMNNKKYKVKNLATGDEREVDQEELIAFLKNA